MTAAAIDGVAIAVAALGPALGVVGWRRRSAAALTIIGASLALAGAAWLVLRIASAAASLDLTSLPSWCSKSVVTPTIWHAVLLAVNAAIVLVLGFVELGAAETSRRSTPTWVLTPTAANLCALTDDPMTFGVMFLAANLLLCGVHQSPAFGSARALFGLFTMAALAVQSGKLIGADLGFIAGLTPNQLATALFVAGLAASIAATPSARGIHGMASRAHCFVGPMILLATYLLHFGDFPIESCARFVLWVLLPAVASGHILSAKWRGRPVEFGSVFCIVGHCTVILCWSVAGASTPAPLVGSLTIAAACLGGTLLPSQVVGPAVEMEAPKPPIQLDSFVRPIRWFELWVEVAVANSLRVVGSAFPPRAARPASQTALLLLVAAICLGALTLSLQSEQGR